MIWVMIWLFILAGAAVHFADSEKITRQGREMFDTAFKVLGYAGLVVAGACALSILIMANAAGGNIDSDQLNIYFETFETSDACALVQTSVDEIESFYSAREAEEDISDALVWPYWQNDPPKNPITDSEKYERLAEAC